MTQPSLANTERAKRLLAHEGALDTAAQCASAAAAVLEKLHGQLDPLLGQAGVDALLARSARLRRADFPCLDLANLESATKLQKCLRQEPPAAAAAASVALFGTFLTLITTFIGERLTEQVLHGAWPTVEDAPRPRGSK